MKIGCKLLPIAIGCIVIFFAYLWFIRLAIKRIYENNIVCKLRSFVDKFG